MKQNIDIFLSWSACEGTQNLIEEISRIMGGIQITENVYSAAKEMLELGKK
jgi:DNA repair ATPase RecN